MIHEQSARPLRMRERREHGLAQAEDRIVSHTRTRSILQLTYPWRVDIVCDRIQRHPWYVEMNGMVRLVDVGNGIALQVIKRALAGAQVVNRGLAAVLPVFVARGNAQLPADQAC